MVEEEGATKSRPPARFTAWQCSEAELRAGPRALWVLAKEGTEGPVRPRSSRTGEAMGHGCLAIAVDRGRGGGEGTPVRDAWVLAKESRVEFQGEIAVGYTRRSSSSAVGEKQELDPGSGTGRKGWRMLSCEEQGKEEGLWRTGAGMPPLG